MTVVSYCAFVFISSRTFAIVECSVGCVARHYVITFDITLNDCQLFVDQLVYVITFEYFCKT